jgi:hypothetical protein
MHLFARRWGAAAWATDVAQCDRQPVLRRAASDLNDSFFLRFDCVNRSRSRCRERTFVERSSNFGSNSATRCRRPRAARSTHARLQRPPDIDYRSLLTCGLALSSRRDYRSRAPFSTRPALSFRARPEAQHSRDAFTAYVRQTPLDRGKYACRTHSGRSTRFVTSEGVGSKQRTTKRAVFSTRQPSNTRMAMSSPPSPRPP